MIVINNNSIHTHVTCTQHIRNIQTKQQYNIYTRRVVNIHSFIHLNYQDALKI